ncbi:MAG TPA: hypothetical protein VJT85_04680 [Gemmatimonadaceae bacterium]|nr:hypothetical protein [Gemmatimonadaceae bacterium]
MPFSRLPRVRALTAVLVVAAPLGVPASRVLAQEPADSAVHEASGASRTVQSQSRHHYWRRMAAGFATSILAHEGAHVVTAVAVGGRPTFGLSKGRPTVYSGLDAVTQKRQQFLFSSMGLNVQALLDEGILDVPHRGGGPFERGVLAGGIATALFYVTIGRTASVSDVDFMARTSSLSKGDITLIYGGVALMHAVRIHYDGRYANFFVRPAPVGEPGLRVGVHVR